MNNATKLIANEAKSIVQAHLDRLGDPQEHQMSQQEKLKTNLHRSRQSWKNRMLFWWRIIIVILKCRNWLN